MVWTELEALTDRLNRGQIPFKLMSGEMSNCEVSNLRVSTSPAALGHSIGVTRA